MAGWDVSLTPKDPEANKLLTVLYLGRARLLLQCMLLHRLVFLSAFPNFDCALHTLVVHFHP
jgi:hypothetical protein